MCSGASGECRSRRLQNAPRCAPEPIARRTTGGKSLSNPSSTLAFSSRSLAAVLIEPPTTRPTCPPGAFCGMTPQIDLVVTLGVGGSDFVVPLVRSSNGWVPAVLVR